MSSDKTNQASDSDKKSEMSSLSKKEVIYEKSKELKEREKELNCLYNLSRILDNDKLQPDEVLSRIVNIIPPAMQYPEDTCVQLKVNGKKIQTNNFKETPWRLTKQIQTRGSKLGILDIYYIDKKPEEDQGPFLQQEIQLVDMIADRLASYIQQLDKDHALKTAGESKVKPEWQIILDMLTKADPQLLFRMTRKMLYFLSRRHNESLIDLMSGLSCPIGSDAKPSEWCGINMPNPKQNLDELKRVQQGVFDIAKDNLPPQEITNLLTLWLRQDKARPLLLSSENSGISLNEITDALKKFGDIPNSEMVLSPEDDVSIRTNLVRRFFTDRLEYINIAKNYVKVQDFVDLLDKVIGPARGSGKLGGKTSGIYLAEKVLEKEKIKSSQEELDEIAFARSWYITSDSMWDLIHYNDLDEVIHTKYMNPNDIKQEQPFLEQVFKNAAFSTEIVEGLRRILREIGDKPVIVRSSSLLEDSFGAAFSGKYKSLFLANIGSENKRLSDLMDAIAEVYASTFSPDPIEYRRERGLLDFTEGMAILIQEVVGTKIGPYYLPAFAGVAFTNNEFRWSPRIQRKDGFIRIVAGLGTRAVDRVTDDYPVLVSPNRPNIRVNALVDETIYYSQRFMDVINLEKGILETVKVDDLLKEYGDEYPILNQIVSVHREGHLYPPSGVILDPSDTEMIVTFAGLFEKEKFFSQMKWILNVLTNRLKTPVDVEFASDGENLYILQCRPQSQSAVVERVTVPKNMMRNRIVFTANKYVTTARIENIRYIVYVNGKAYEKLERREDMLNVAQVVSKLNEVLPKRQFILMGPGRWGSRGDIKLGVPVQYRDINNTSLLIEIARKKEGGLPELSFGTHFFQDLVEANIQYLPLYPDDKDTVFNEELLSMAPNKLDELLPQYSDVDDVVKIIEVSDVADGGTLSVMMDGDANEAMAYLVPIDHSAWRMQKVHELARKLNPQRYGVVDMYVFGSTHEETAGAASDIDLIVHVRGTDEQKEDLLAWFREENARIAKENKKRTGKRTEDILDVHLITDEDIERRTSWATHIDSLHGRAKKISLHPEG